MSKAKSIQLDMFVAQESSISKEEIFKMLVTDDEQQIINALDLAINNNIDIQKELKLVQYIIKDSVSFKEENERILLIKIFKYLYNPTALCVYISMDEASNKDFMYVCNTFFTKATQIHIHMNKITTGKMPTDLAQIIADFVNKCNRLICFSNKNIYTAGKYGTDSSSSFMTELINPLIINQSIIEK